MPARKNRPDKYTLLVACGYDKGWRSRSQPTLSETNKRKISEDQVGDTTRSLYSFVRLYCDENHLADSTAEAWRNLLGELQVRVARDARAGYYTVADLAHDLTPRELKSHHQFMYDCACAESPQGLLDAFESRVAAHIASLQQQPARAR